MRISTIGLTTIAAHVRPSATGWWRLFVVTPDQIHLVGEDIAITAFHMIEGSAWIDMFPTYDDPEYLIELGKSYARDLIELTGHLLVEIFVEGADGEVIR